MVLALLRCMPLPLIQQLLLAMEATTQGDGIKPSHDPDLLAANAACAVRRVYPVEDRAVLDETAPIVSLVNNLGNQKRIKVGARRIRVITESRGILQRMANTRLQKKKTMPSRRIKRKINLAQTTEAAATNEKIQSYPKPERLV